jgi:hypothetical protein
MKIITSACESESKEGRMRKNVRRSNKQIKRRYWRM